MYTVSFYTKGYWFIPISEEEPIKKYESYSLALGNAKTMLPDMIKKGAGMVCIVNIYNLVYDRYPIIRKKLGAKENIGGDKIPYSSLFKKY